MVTTQAHGGAYRVKDAARFLGCSERFIQREVAEGRLGHFRIGRELRFLPADLDAYVRATHRDPEIAS